MSQRDAFVAAARSMLGVKWRHQGRQPWAVDCLGLIVLAMRAAGREVQDREGYPATRSARACATSWCASAVSLACGCTAASR